jgi:uncharacterized protein YacL
MFRWIDKKLRRHYELVLEQSFVKKLERRFVIDTSTLIDGRVISIFKHDGFDGLVVVNQFVIAFLKKMAASEKIVTSTKGKRGLLVIEELKKTLWKVGRDVLTDAQSLPEGSIEEQLVDYCKKFNGILVTMDNELTKIAKAHHIKVLNLYGLMNDLRDTIFPGDRYTVKLMDFGEDEGQCIGYLKDNSMVVVDDSKRYIGKAVPIVVRNVVNSDHGRIVFAKIEWGEG